MTLTMAGWMLAALAVAFAIWLWRKLAQARAHAAELLYARLDVENQLDLLRVGACGDVAAAAAAAGASVGDIARHLHEPLETIREGIERTGASLAEYREQVRRFDAAVQYCLQPVELILGADKASLAELVSHVEGARRKLFETRSLVEKNPLHSHAAALDASIEALRNLSAYTRSLLDAHPDEEPLASTRAAAATAVDGEAQAFTV